MKIAIDINKCSECPHFMATPYPTEDSWERAEYWWCKAEDVVAPNEEAEQRRVGLKEGSKLLKLRYIGGYVEWHDKTPIPVWCPCKVQTRPDAKMTIDEAKAAVMERAKELKIVLVYAQDFHNASLARDIEKNYLNLEE